MRAKQAAEDSCGALTVDKGFRFPQPRTDRAIRAADVLRVTLDESFGWPFRALIYGTLRQGKMDTHRGRDGVEGVGKVYWT